MTAQQVHVNSEPAAEIERHTPTPVRAPNYDLIALMLVGALLPLVSLIPVPLVRVPVGLVLALGLPGFALTTALFPERRDLDRVTRLVLSFGLSVALIPLLSLILSALPWGIRPWPVTLSLSLWTLALGGIAIWRRRSLAPAQPFSRDDPYSTPPWRDARRSQFFKQVALTGCTLVGLLAAIAVSGWFIHPPAHLTEFYVLGGEGTVDRYPRQVTLNEDINLILGVVNGESARRTFSAEVWAVGQPGSDDPSLLTAIETIELPSEQRIEFDISFRMPRTGPDQEVAIYLYRVGDDAPYRELRLWFDVADESAARST